MSNILAWNRSRLTHETAIPLEGDYKCSAGSFKNPNMQTQTSRASSEHASRGSCETNLSADSTHNQSALPQNKSLSSTTSGSNFGYDKVCWESPSVAHGRVFSEGSLLPHDVNHYQNALNLEHRPRSHSDAPSHLNQADKSFTENRDYICSHRAIRGTGISTSQDQHFGAFTKPSSYGCLLKKQLLKDQRSSGRFEGTKQAQIALGQNDHPQHNLSTALAAFGDRVSTSRGIDLSSENISSSLAAFNLTQNDGESGPHTNEREEQLQIASKYIPTIPSVNERFHKHAIEQFSQNLSSPEGVKNWTIGRSAQLDQDMNGSINCTATASGVSVLQASSKDNPGITPRQRQAKQLAALIRSGGAEDRGSNVRRAAAANLTQSSVSSTTHNTCTSICDGINITSKFVPIADPLVLKFFSKGGMSDQDIRIHNPFVEHWIKDGPCDYGVIRITDIPYNTVKPEIVAAIGERAPMVKMPKNAGTYAIHITMERSSAKSNDCFVEFPTLQAAQNLIARITSQGNHKRIKDRQVKFCISSQEELMSELFPKASCVIWNGQEPVIYEDKNSRSKFHGFVNSEEMVATVKWAQTPQRSRFAKGHPQRTYESMISLMEKYPWWAADKYTVKERDVIFKAVLDQINALTEHLTRNRDQVPELNHQLLGELLHAGLQVPAFSENQRSQLIDATMGHVKIPVYVTRQAPYWPFEVLRKRDEASEHLVEYYASMLKHSSSLNSYDSKDLNAVAGTSLKTSSPFGSFFVNWPNNKQSLTMAEAAAFERQTLEICLLQK